MPGSCSQGTGQFGNPGQALSSVGAKARAGLPVRVRGLTGTSRGPLALLRGWGTAPARGKQLPALRTHLLVFVGTHRASRWALPLRTAFVTTKRKREQWP